MFFPNTHNSDGDFLKAGGKESARRLRTAPAHGDSASLSTSAVISYEGLA